MICGVCVLGRQSPRLLAVPHCGEHPPVWRRHSAVDRGAELGGLLRGPGAREDGADGPFGLRGSEERARGREGTIESKAGGGKGAQVAACGHRMGCSDEGGS